MCSVPSGMLWNLAHEQNLSKGKVAGVERNWLTGREVMGWFEDLGDIRKSESSYYAHTPLSL